MKKILLLTVFTTIFILNIGCGKTQTMEKNMKLTKITTVEEVKEEVSRVNQSLFDQFIVKDKTDEPKKDEKYIITEIPVEVENSYEDEYIKIDFTVLKDRIVSNFQNKTDKFFYINWSKLNIDMDSYKKPQKLIRLGQSIDTARFDQKDEVINKNQKKVLEYTSVENIKTISESTASAETTNYWVSGNLMGNEDKWFEMTFMIELYKDVYRNYVFKFEE
ncbi:MAG: hypothetical protein GX287_04275 [Fusobacteria bacterium]|nr:hypothetical protein [Fusobacteriota bacterium]